MNELTTFAGVRNDQDNDVGVFGFDTSTDFGKKFIDLCIEIIKSTNMNNYLKYNITRIITEAIQKLCYQTNVSIYKLNYSRFYKTKDLRFIFGNLKGIVFYMFAYI